MADLDALLRANEVILKCEVSEKHRNEVAKRISDAWESLATFIGVSNVEVNDIKIKYQEPLERRLAMMRRWHELWGSEATYLRLVEGLKQIGRRDLIESLLRMAKDCQYQLLSWEVRCLARLCSLQNFIYTCPTIFVIVLITMLFFGNRLGELNQILGKSNTSITRQHFAEDITTHSQTNKALNHFDYRTLSNCSFPDNDLPIIHPLFVGRDNDMQQVLSKVTKANILNINGAPGFGKSTLAIHVGYEIFKNGTSVRYTNIEDKAYSVVNQWQKSEREATPESFNNVDNTHLQQKSLMTLSRHAISASKHQIHGIIESDENFFEELRKWSETIKCTSVLILDNCDDILVSTSRDEFLSLINSMVKKSSFKLHIVIVSREKLLYLDSFDYWTVGELNQSASVELLDKIAPAIDNRSLTEVAELVEGCPLALKVVGQLLHIHGAQLIHKLKKEVMTTLDKASVLEQRFRVIMDVALNRLGVLQNCGYALSLFPGSFDEAAGSAVVQKECLETYVKHSLVNEYSLAINYRYKIHRLIKEYLQEKISIGENMTFITTFRKYFQALLLKQMGRQESTLDTDKYTISLELHNLHYLKELLLADDNNIHLLSEELAVLAMLLDIKLIQPKQIHRYYALFMDKVEEVCSLLNIQLCEQLYTNIVRYLYQQCKCQTFTAYIQNFFISPCMEYFKCPVVQHLQDLYVSGIILRLSEDEISYISLIASAHCYGGYYTRSKYGNTMELSYDYGHFIIFVVGTFLMSTLVIIIICCYCSIHFAFISIVLLFAYSMTTIAWCFHSKTVMVILISVAIVLHAFATYPISVLLQTYELTIKSEYHPTLRVLEIVPKFVCHFVVNCIAVICIILLLIFFAIFKHGHLRYSPILTITSLVLLLSLSIIFVIESMPHYCCQFIPVCI